MKVLVTNQSNTTDLRVILERHKLSQWIKSGLWRVRPGNSVPVEVEVGTRYVMEHVDE